MPSLMYKTCSCYWINSKFINKAAIATVTHLAPRTIGNSGCNSGKLYSSFSFSVIGHRHLPPSLPVLNLLHFLVICAAVVTTTPASGSTQSRSTVSEFKGRLGTYPLSFFLSFSKCAYEWNHLSLEVSVCLNCCVATWYRLSLWSSLCVHQKRIHFRAVMKQGISPSPVTRDHRNYQWCI